MNEASITRYITNTFDGLDIATMPGVTFFFYDPGSKLPPKKRMPFATIVNTDGFDRASNLGRDGVFRLNIGVAKDTYRALFGPQPDYADGDGVVDTGHDFTALDQIMPHPVYAPASWICVLNPSETTFEKVRGYLAEAYELAVARHAKIMAEG